ncbi:MAG: hypothetical protein O8C66_05460 [Candidatus Methanoperedens sp.]|nr:hypothetical protein [Candidatus Methanoperedens sp.]MCZ7369938.1 hypothetical protein [Candidatus Methanoperedens sp.]
MAKRSIDIALTEAEAGEGLETVYENVCTLATEPELCFNYATTDELREWKFLEGCFSALLRDKKDVIVQVITTYQERNGAALAYKADVNYFKKNNYGRPLKGKMLGDDSIMFKKNQSDGITYNILFLKNTFFAAISGKYKIEKAENIDHITGLAEKIESKIPE